MEAVYAKLYDKYTKLKANKFEEMDEVNKAQEEKFLNYVNVAEELMDFLKKENDELRIQNIELRKEVASMGSSKDEKLAEYQELLMEEKQKNRELSIEVVKIQNLQQEGFRDNSQHMSNGRKSRKRGRIAVVEEASMLRQATTHQESELVADLYVDSMSGGDPIRTQQLESPRRTIGSTGAGAFEESPAQNLYQFIVECLLGMKVSITKNEELVISALHESSGYSISMKTVNFGGREELELLCRVISLGTLEQDVPDCMKEDIIVSKTMIPIFFGRVSSVINKH